MTEQPIVLSSARLLAELVTVTNRLCVLMEQETALLKAPGLPRLEHIVPEKLKLSARYDGLMQMLRMQPAISLQNEPDAPRHVACSNWWRGRHGARRRRISPMARNGSAMAPAASAIPRSP